MGHIRHFHLSVLKCFGGIWHYTVSDRALIFPTPLLSQLQGWPGCQKIQFFFSQINLFSFCARIEPKLNKLQKTVKIDKKSSKNPCFLVVFWSLLNFGSILAQKHTKCKYLSIVPFFCHPGHPWSCESSGVITTLISLFKIFQQQCHLVTFFNFPKMKPKINIIDLRLLERSLYAPIFTNVKIARNYIIFWWKCGKSRSQIWHCDIWLAPHYVLNVPTLIQGVPH